MQKNKLSEEEKKNLREFISDIYSDSLTNDDFYFIGTTSTKNNAKRTNKLDKIVDEFIYQIENQEEDLFYTCKTFYWYLENNIPRRKQKNIKSIKTFYVDIDHIEVSHLETKEQVKEYLYNNYPFLNEIGIFPQYVNLTGHGMHLYFILTDAFQFITIDNKKRQKEINNLRKSKWKDVSLMLCSLFKGDSSVSSDISKILRLPYTYNMKEKDNHIRSKFFNFREDYPTISYNELRTKLEILLCDEQEIETNKSTKTNGSGTSKTYLNRPYFYDENTINNIREYYKNHKEYSKYDRCFGNIIYFLEKVLLPHRHYDIKGYRHTFILCIIKIHQNNLREYKETLEHCLEVNNLLIEPLENREIESLVYYYYDPRNTYCHYEKETSKLYIKLSNERIKNLLDITPEEQNLCHKTSFYKEHKELKEKILNELKNEKHKENNIYYEKKNKEEIYYKILKENPNASIYELMEMMNLSKRQVQRIKKKYKESLQ